MPFELTKTGHLSGLFSKIRLINSNYPYNNNNNNNNNKTLFQEGNTISTELISLAALKYLQIDIVDE